jgi:hypothetical protein
MCRVDKRLKGKEMGIPKGNIIRQRVWKEEVSRSEKEEKEEKVMERLVLRVAEGGFGSPTSEVASWHDPASPPRGCDAPTVSKVWRQQNSSLPENTRAAK